MAPGALSRCKLIKRAIVHASCAIEIIVGLGTFSFKDQPIKARLEVFARVPAVLLRIRGTRNAHYTLSNESVHIMQKCKSTSISELKGRIVAFLCTCAAFRSLSLNCAYLALFFSRDRTHTSCEKLQNNVLTND